VLKLEEREEELKKLEAKLAETGRELLSANER
jgi:hypothetical protein